MWWHIPEQMNNQSLLPDYEFKEETKFEKTGICKYFININKSAAQAAEKVC